MKKLLSLFLVVGFIALLIGCHSGGHAPFANPGENGTAAQTLTATVNANGRLSSAMVFPSGATVNTTEDNTMQEGVVVNVTETKTSSLGVNPMGEPAYIYVYTITANLITQDALGNDVSTPVTSLEKPITITLPTNHLGTTGIAYVGIRADESEPWRFSKVSENGSVTISARNLRASSTEKLSSSYKFGLFKMGIQLALFVYNKPVEETSSDISADGVNITCTEKIEYDSNNKYTEDLDVALKINGVNLDRLKASDFAIKVIYRSENKTPESIKADGQTCGISTEEKADAAVSGKSYFVHTLTVPALNEGSLMSGEADLKFTLNLKGIATADFPTSFLVEISNKGNIENLIPFSYSSSMSFTAEQAKEDEPEPTGSSYTITYNLDGGKLAEGVTNPSEYGEASETFTLNNPIKTGYTFAGWTGTDLEVATTEVTITTGSTGDREYTATWTENAPDTYTLTLSKGTGIATVTGADTYTAGQEITIGYTLSDGYEFVSWSSEDVEVVSNKFTMPAKDVVLTANAKVIEYEITYTLGEGATLGEGITNPTGYDVTSATITLNNPTKTGYTFKGWSGTGLTGDENTTVTIAQGSTGDKSYTANWSINSYHLDLIAGTGIATVTGSGTYEYNSSVTASCTMQEGYEFANWTGNITTDTFNMPAKNATMTANATPIEYTISYIINGGEFAEGVASPTVYTVESEGFSVPTPTKSNYNFKAWYDKNGDSIATIVPGTTGDKILTASYTPKFFDITYDLANGTLEEGKTNPASYSIESQKITLNNPTRDGFDFLGWTGTGITEGTASKTLTIPQGSTENRSYVASWTESNSDVLTFTLSDGVTLELKKVPEKDYYMGTYEVTQEQYFAIMNTNPSSFRGELDKNVNPHGNTTASSPVECVSWNDIMDGENSFKAKITASLTAQLTAKGLSGYQFTLPTQEQWVYTCNAGGVGGFCKGANGDQVTDSTLGDYAWYTSNSDNKTHTVGSKNANYWGFYDMHGNVYEWTSTVEDNFRIMCGGSWRISANRCRSDRPDVRNPDYRLNIFGFRVVLVAPAN